MSTEPRAKTRMYGGREGSAGTRGDGKGKRMCIDLAPRDSVGLGRHGSHPRRRGHEAAGVAQERREDLVALGNRLPGIARARLSSSASSSSSSSSSSHLVSLASSRLTSPRPVAREPRRVDNGKASSRANKRIRTIAPPRLTLCCA